jgi:hypothetical protein
METESKCSCIVSSNEALEFRTKIAYGLAPTLRAPMDLFSVRIPTGLFQFMHAVGAFATAAESRGGTLRKLMSFPSKGSKQSV